MQGGRRPAAIPVADMTPYQVEGGLVRVEQAVDRLTVEVLLSCFIKWVSKSEISLRHDGDDGKICRFGPSATKMTYWRWKLV